MPALVDPGGPRANTAGRWGDLRRRTLSAVVLAPLAVLCMWLGGVAWAALMAVAAVGLGMEWAGLCRAAPLRLPGLLVPLGAVAGGLVAEVWAPAPAMLVLLAACALTWWASARPALAIGVPYIGVPLVALAWLRGPLGMGGFAAGRGDLLFLVAVVWACDIGAYAVGRLVGGPKLAPSISPGKTWSGAVGGLIAAMAAGEAVAQAMAPAPWARVATVALVLAAVSILGDLLESWIKRRFGVKDSGRLIPGHGGLLDRLDGLLAAAPAAALLAAALGRGGLLWN